MKTFLLVLLGVVIGLAAAGGLYSFRDAAMRGKERRFVADIRVVTRELERYRNEHTAYPVACNAKALSDQLGPQNVVSQFGETWIQYCSDGQQYVLAFVPFGGGAYGTAYGAPLLAANNQMIAWPDVGPPETDSGGRPGRGAETNP